MNLTFDAAKHEYRLDGAVVPSVTQVLAPLYDFDRIPADVLERKRQIGKALDDLIELDLRDDLDESSIDPALDGYFKAWRLFSKEKRVSVLELQKPVFSKTFRFAGTPDFWGTLDDHAALVDWKCTADMHPAVALQTAGYELAGEESIVGWPRGIRRYGVQFKPDGTYAITQYIDKQDRGTFLSLLSLQNWKARNGLLTKEKQ